MQFDLDNSRIDECVNMLYNDVNVTSKDSLCGPDGIVKININNNTTTIPMIDLLTKKNVTYGNEVQTQWTCKFDRVTTHFPEV